MVSIMSSGAGSVGVSARPSLPTTIATSGNRQRTMSRAFRSSTPWAIDMRGIEIGMSITIPSSSGVMNSRPRGVTLVLAQSAITISNPIANALARQPSVVSPTAINPAASSVRKSQCKPTQDAARIAVAARTQSSGAGWSSR